MAPWTSRLLYIVLTITGNSGFQHGYHLGVTNIPKNIMITFVDYENKTVNKKNHMDNDLLLRWSSTVAIYAMGGILGSSLTAFFSDRWGRKYSLVGNNLLVVIGAITLVMAMRQKLYLLFICGRFVVGVNAGLNNGVCQIYLMEIAPDQIRGSVGSCYQLMKVFGIFMSQISGYFLDAEEHWPFIFIIPLLPAAVQTISLFFCPESPMYFLLIKENENKMVKALQWLRNKEDVQEEINTIIYNDNLIKELRLVTFKRMFINPTLRMSLMGCVALMVGLQFTGINLVVYYSILSFKQVGLRDPDALIFTFALSMLSVLVVFVTIFVIDHVERKKLLLTGYLGLTVVTTILTIALLFMTQNTCNDVCKCMCGIFLMAFIVLYNPGIGCISYFYVAEIFHYSARSIGLSIAIPVNWCANVVVAVIFMPLITLVGYSIYGVFALLDLFFFIYIYKYLPETYNLSTTSIIELYK